jgi:hypothetical protein
MALTRRKTTPKPAPKPVEVVETDGPVLCPEVVPAVIERNIQRCKKCRRLEAWNSKGQCYECWRESTGYVFDAEQNRFVMEGK